MLCEVWNLVYLDQYPFGAVHMELYIFFCFEGVLVKTVSIVIVRSGYDKEYMIHCLLRVCLEHELQTPNLVVSVNLLLPLDIGGDVYDSLALLLQHLILMSIENKLFFLHKKKKYFK